MELPRNAPRRKIDIYLHQVDQVRPILAQIQKNIEPKVSPKKGENDNIVAVLHGIGPDGCTAVASVITQLRQSQFSNLISTSEPLIELWEGLPTFHAFISRNKPKETSYFFRVFYPGMNQQQQIIGAVFVKFRWHAMPRGFRVVGGVNFCWLEFCTW